MNRIHLAQDRDQYKAPVNRVMDLRATYLLDFTIIKLYYTICNYSSMRRNYFKINRHENISHHVVL
jgi:hypothetical protein